MDRVFVRVKTEGEGGEIDKVRNRRRKNEERKR